VAVVGIATAMAAATAATTVAVATKTTAGTAMAGTDNYQPKVATEEMTVAATTRDRNTTTSQGGQERDATRGGDRGEGELADVRQSCHMRQCGNKLGRTRGKWEVELPAQREAAAHQDAVLLVRGWEADAAQGDVLHPFSRIRVIYNQNPIMHN
jgi:hypothetical protein